MWIKNFRHGMHKDLKKLPDNLPQPNDDGKSDHLVGITIPNIILTSTEGVMDISEIDAQYIVLFSPNDVCSRKSIAIRME